MADLSLNQNALSRDVQEEARLSRMRDIPLRALMAQMRSDVMLAVITRLR